MAETERPFYTLVREIRRSREQLSWTQEKLAETADVETKSVGRLEQGHRIKPGTFQKIAEAIHNAFERKGLDTPQLLYREDSSATNSSGWATLCDYWLEVIDEGKEKELSIGLFHEMEGKRKYDGCSYFKDGKIRYQWHSFVCELDHSQNRVVYSYNYGKHKGDGFGAIQLEPGPRGTWNAINAYFVTILEELPSLRFLKMQRLSEAAEHHRYPGFSKSKLESASERSKIINFLYRKINKT